MNKSLKLDKELAEYRQNFYNIYHSKIVPIFAEFENERKRELYKLIRPLLIMGIIIVLFVSVAIYYFFFNPLCLILVLTAGLAPLVVVMCFIGIYLLISSFNSDFVDKLKASCMQKVVEAFDNIKWYDKYKYKLISDDDLSVSQIFAWYNHREHYDSFKGTYKGVDFEIEESCLQHKGSDRRDTIDVFRGVIIKVPANKKVKGTTIVANKYDRNI